MRLLQARVAPARPFDMSRYGQRWVALRVAYIGTRYHGMQYAEGVETVEGVLFEALTKTRLIADRDSCGFSRGGRTDRGVSALGQVVALRVRSSVAADFSARFDATSRTCRGRCSAAEARRAEGWLRRACG
ncbi:hypothetical protein EMIHUDRAFT_201974 [Emiliania huxleyi CCMP1516]|uniref:tRNA pseudouridine synthase n=2 Tax=Emiliania huxleyi TaxID=2903 RepID=A0A0D3KET7_EMIH1|nr:hypothetical protein EMIHUDRAFT_201974 [Emiliania huxleyi CCMP1516]EOD34272.1 hypothetical protein EMIHUDRAFT_201974 [Emiliania huxleyi CCMP1516]|eukprot:XP_005786701.1 hypothetical protein EMIHUDRAFT_201974 [Emiliania huxleyi CCMP1516]